MDLTWPAIVERAPHIVRIATPRLNATGFVFTPADDCVSLMGVVPAYVSNCATGEALPRIAILTDVTEFRQMIAAFKSLDQVQAGQTPPTALHAGRTPPPEASSV